MKRNKGFTLIELLAVIVILAVIALIAVPVVMDIIDKANMSAFKDSAYGIIKAGDLHYSKQQMSLNGVEEDEVFEFPNNIGKLQVKGDLPQGTMVVTKTGEIALAITNGKYCITKNYDDEDIKLSENTSRCAIQYTLASVATNSEELGITKVDECVKRGTVCNFGADVEEPTSFAIQVNDTNIYKFYVINDDGKEVTMIMDRNLYSEGDKNNGNVMWISRNDYNLAHSDEGDTYCGFISCNDEGPLTAIAHLKERTATWDNIVEKKYIYSDSEENYTSFSVLSRARLPMLDELRFIMQENGGVLPEYFLENLKNNGDNNTNGYWTSTTSSVGSKCVWVVEYQVGLYNDAWISVENSTRGIRPVITLSK